MSITDVEHPAVAAVRQRLAETGRTVSIVAFVLRQGVAAVVAVEGDTAERQTQATYWPVIVEQVDEDWVVADYVGGHGSQLAPPGPRQALTAQPPRLMWDHMSTTGAPGLNGEHPTQAWTVMIGRAARDGRVFTVVSDLETQSCLVGEDGLVAVLFRNSWGDKPRPRLRITTATGEVIALFNGESGIPR